VTTDYDLVVIGAGIHGAAVAKAAAQRGYRALVLEQYEGPGLCTSSKSSKLIHGGLRYLESGQFRLVRECLHERQRLLDEQPDLVKLIPFHIPVYSHTRRRPWLIAAGLSLYALLGGKGFRRISRQGWRELDGLKTRDLKCVFRYWDAQTDDRQLTGRIVEEARRLGAQVHYDTRFVAAQCTAVNCEISFETAETLHTVRACALVNASGPWVNTVLEKISPRITPLSIELIQGTHIVVPGTLKHGIYYLEAPRDQRAVFVMPWQGNIMIGTTETPYRGDPARVRPLEGEILYLLETWNHYFDKPIRREDVIESFAGLRVLPASDSNPFDRSRDTRLHRDINLPMVLSIYGGKLTSHRHTAMRVLKALGLSRQNPQR
jgi:glycerol-3-phosphate dehydrogenase